MATLEETKVGARVRGLSLTGVATVKAVEWFGEQGVQVLYLDLRTPRGQELFRALARTADVVVENFQPGTLEEWGLGPDVLLGEHPDLIVTRASVYGQTGPYRDRPGLDRNGIGFGGLLLPLVRRAGQGGRGSRRAHLARAADRDARRDRVPPGRRPSGRRTCPCSADTGAGRGLLLAHRSAAEHPAPGRDRAGRVKCGKLFPA